jgi:hypothetical protein
MFCWYTIFAIVERISAATEGISRENSNHRQDSSHSTELVDWGVRSLSLFIIIYIIITKLTALLTLTPIPLALLFISINVVLWASCFRPPASSSIIFQMVVANAIQAGHGMV